MECFCSRLNIAYLSFTKDIEPIDSLGQVVEKICKSGFQVSCADHDLTLGPWASPGDLASMPACQPAHTNRMLHSVNVCECVWVLC